MQDMGIASNPAALIGLALFLVGLLVSIRQARGDHGAGTTRRWGPVLVLAGLGAYAVVIVVWFFSSAR